MVSFQIWVLHHHHLRFESLAKNIKDHICKMWTQPPSPHQRCCHWHRPCIAYLPPPYLLPVETFELAIGFVVDYFAPKYCIVLCECVWGNWHIKGMVVDYFVQYRQILHSFELRKGLVVDYFTWHRQAGLRQRGGRVSHCQDRPGQRSQLGTITVLSLTSRFFESQPEWHLDSSWNLGQLFLWPLIPGQHRSDFFLWSQIFTFVRIPACATLESQPVQRAHLSRSSKSSCPGW